MSFSSKITTMVNIIKNTRNTLISKGETLEYDNDLPQKVGDLTTLLYNIIERPDTSGTSISIAIPAGVTKIGERAFYLFRKLTSVSFNADLKEIGADAFGSCAELTTIVFPDNIERIGSYAFRECVNLTSVTFPANEPRMFNLGDGVFSACTSLEEITLPDYIHNISWSLFDGCRNLRNITISANTIGIGNNGFAGCGNLKSFPFSKVTGVGTSGFANCGFTDVDLSLSRCGYIGNEAFRECKDLVSVELPTFLEMLYENVFYNCVNLETINIPNSLTTISRNTFSGCTALENVTIETGFNCNNLNLSVSTLYTANTIVSWLNALADRTGDTAYTLIIGSTNINKLTSEQIAIATNKNWNLA